MPFSLNIFGKVLNSTNNNSNLIQEGDYKMVSNEIGTNILFKKQLGLDYEIDQKYVGLKMKENNILSFNFRVPGALKDDVEAYFKKFKLGEPILVDIGGTGDMRCIFKGVSPVLKNKDKMDQYFLSATLQEDKKSFGRGKM